jgi:hypothetical protein
LGNGTFGCCYGGGFDTPIDYTMTFTVEEIPTVVPLPAALPLFAGGLGGLGLMDWRRRRRAAAA